MTTRQGMSIGRAVLLIAGLGAASLADGGPALAQGLPPPVAKPYIPAPPPPSVDNGPFRPCTPDTGQKAAGDANGTKGDSDGKRTASDDKCQPLPR
jgi:hypothetical protein